MICTTQNTAQHNTACFLRMWHVVTFDMKILLRDFALFVARQNFRIRCTISRTIRLREQKNNRTNAIRLIQLLRLRILLKALMPITFSSPGAQPEVVYFLISNESPYFFLIANPQFQLQILCSFGDIIKSVKLNGIPENNFSCIFIITSSPGVHTFLCLWRINKKLPQGETSQNAFQRSRSIN